MYYFLGDIVLKQNCIYKGTYHNWMLVMLIQYFVNHIIGSHRNDYGIFIVFNVKWCLHFNENAASECFF